MNPNRRDFMMREVARNIEVLEETFGVTTLEPLEGSEESPPPSIDPSSLSTVLALPKGLQLLARCVETGMLPHPSACLVLPAALSNLLSAPRPANRPQNAKEDRLLLALQNNLISVSDPPLPATTFKDAVRKICAHHEAKGTLRQR